MGDEAKTSSGSEAPANLTVPLAAEAVQVQRKRVETGRVSVQIKTQERTVPVDEVLTHEHVDVTRVPIGRPIADVPPIREVDGVIIVPIVEEVLVVERRLVLKEEIHLKRVQSTVQHHEVVTIHEQHATVDRIPVQEEPS